MIVLRNDNVVVDLAAIPTLLRSMVYPEVNPRDFLLRLVDVIGAERILYGTDNLDDGMNPELISSLGMTEAETADVLATNALRVYGGNLTPAEG